MKADPEVKMISAEAPILFAKGCDIFITELTMRAWIHAEENKRRTLQRSDIASALAKSDMFDFLIDIVPREEAAAHSKRQPGSSSGAQGAPQAMAGQHVQAPNHQHPMAATDYTMPGHGLVSEADYRQPMYAAQVPPQQAAYGQAQAPMYGEMPAMYDYSAMQPQQVSSPRVRKIFATISNNLIFLTRSLHFRQPKCSLPRNTTLRMFEVFSFSFTRFLGRRRHQIHISANMERVETEFQYSSNLSDNPS